MSGAAGILTRATRRVAAFVTVVVTTAACAGRPAPPGPATSVPTERVSPRPLTLELVDVVTTSARLLGPGVDRTTLFGSVSGLVRDEATGRYLAVIDDRQPARLAWLDIAHDGRLAVTAGRVVALGAAPGVDPRVVTGADREAIVSLPGGRFVAVEEGHLVRTPAEGPSPGAWSPALLTFGADAVVTRIDPLPPMFAIGPDGGGIRSNQGVESLARTPDGRLIAGLEQPRYADAPAVQRQGRPFGGGGGGPSRLVEFVAEGEGWRAARQWAYPIPPTPRVAGFDEICNDGELGLTDLLALDDTRLLALERACLQNPTTREVRNVVRLQVVDTAGAEDVSAVSSLVGRVPRAVAKTLAIDFDTLIPRLPPSLARLDNFEALAFGPVLPDGRRTLLVVSDDNFRPNQQFVVLLLAIGGETGA